ncbi:hypothetical protein BS47DRAFT_277779 [Hydnum rufescens UP504]|uniref:EamA domain-containing protein n=1 Tax=Hydnum rufescens UP504 TaxID=1448309 RepID=A0A9P6AKZ7_9AGAM|nr:hypothetical protein BS47DRAFT_277779 [Hydnum rufescens UP504]
MLDTYNIGLLLLLIVVFLWTSSNFITQNLFDDGFQMPFLVTYFNTASFSVYLLPLLLYRWPRVSALYSYMPVTEIPEGLSPAEGRKRLPPLSTRETANLAILFCFLWFVANWSQNASLEHTSVASSTILASMSGFFTLLLGRVFHVEAFSFVRLGTVMTSFLGVVLVSLADSDSPDSPLRGRPFSPEGGPSRRPLLGDILGLLSAIFYAFYVILLKVRIQDESRVNMRLFFGFVGLFNVLCMWPIGFLLHWTKLEPFRLPSSKMQWVAIAVNMAITFSSDYIYVLAMLKTTPWSSPSVSA